MPGWTKKVMLYVAPLAVVGGYYGWRSLANAQKDTGTFESVGNSIDNTLQLLQQWGDKCVEGPSACFSNTMNTMGSGLAPYYDDGMQQLGELLQNLGLSEEPKSLGPIQKVAKYFSGGDRKKEGTGWFGSKTSYKQKDRYDQD